MAQVAVGFVVGKLANIIQKEMEHLGGVGEKVQRVQRELIRIQCCLKDADSKRKGDARVQNWLNELRDVAYRIEDATDTFLLKVEVQLQKDPRFLQKLKKLCNKPLEVHILHKLGTELEHIQNQLEEISKSRVDYGIKDLPDNSKGEAVKMPLQRATYSEVDETEVVGLRAHKINIMKLLRPEKTLRRAIITIVGTGGLGKTTLAHMVYRSAKEEFEYHIMLSISQQFSLTNILRRMLLLVSRQISLIDPLRNMVCELVDYVLDDQYTEEVITVLKSFLSNRRYLIILDDVWAVDLWNQLKDVLPDIMNGSRVMMTSRFIHVARSADSKMPPYSLNFLNDKKSLDLLLKKALPYQKPDEEWPDDLLELANKLSKKCKGLPLALIVLGGILSTKEQNYLTWERVLRTMDWHSDGKDCMDVLAMSYEAMPYHLKACFLYLCSFPEDYEISAKRLIRMWIAEGFIPQDGRTTMEEMAENYLEELFQRSMIQVSSRCMNGLIKYFHVHDLLRDLAMHEAKQENFVTVFSQASDVKEANRGIRRASLRWNLEFMEYVGPKIRSLLWFGLELPKCSKFRLLKVLEFVGVVNDTLNLARGIEKLIHLKYLGFRNCKIDISSCSFHRMKTLETLDMRGTEAPLPNALWTICTLRHVLYDHGDFDIPTFDGPKPTADLRNLKTMQWVSPPRTWARELPVLNNLCKLGISYPFDDWVIMTNVLKTLTSLLSLGIKGVVEFPKEVIYPSALPNYQNLQSLYLEGKWSMTVTLDAGLFPPRLLKLTLIGSQLHQNPMPELGKLKSLKKLCLERKVSNYWGPTICPAGFPVLQYLIVVDSSIKDLTVANGAIPKLTYLQVHGKLKFDLPSELQHVTVNFSCSSN